MVWTDTAIWRTRRKGPARRGISRSIQICAVTTKALRYYEEIGLLRPAHTDPFNQNGYEPRYPMRDVYHSDPARTTPEQLVTEVILPVVKK